MRLNTRISQKKKRKSFILAFLLINFTFDTKMCFSAVYHRFHEIQNIQAHFTIRSRHGSLLNPFPRMLHFSRCFLRLRNIIELIISFIRTDFLAILGTLGFTVTVRATGVTLDILSFTAIRRWSILLHFQTTNSILHITFEFVSVFLTSHSRFWIRAPRTP